MYLFGVRTEAECLYRAEFEAFRARPGYRLVFAFSREQTAPDGRRLYVQHRMADASASSETCSAEIRRISTFAA